jgi:PEP-CTERM motif-containing protein
VKIHALLRFAAATWLAAFFTGAAAEPITFIFTGMGSGSLNGTAFSSSAFTITGHADTLARSSDAGPGVYYTDHLTADIDIAGLGDFAFLTPTRTFVNTGASIVGFSRAGASGLDLYDGPQDSALATWDMLSAIGPISGSAQIQQWMGVEGSDEPVLTSGGELIMNDGTSDATFEATVGIAAIPEPETYSMLLAGMGLIGFIARRRRRRSGALAA